MITLEMQAFIFLKSQNEFDFFFSVFSWDYFSSSSSKSASKSNWGILSCFHLTRYSGHCSRSHILYSQSFFEVYVVLTIEVYESERTASLIPSVLLTARHVAMLLQGSLGPFHFHADKHSTWCEQLNSWKNRLSLCNWPCIPFSILACQWELYSHRLWQWVAFSWAKYYVPYSFLFGKSRAMSSSEMKVVEEFQSRILIIFCLLFG